MIARSTLAVVLVLAALAGCSQPCANIQQTVVLDSVGTDLSSLIDACLAKSPTDDNTCSVVINPPGACRCRPLCDRVLTIIDQFPGPEDLETCGFYPASMAPNPPSVPTQPLLRVRYRPSSCP